MSKAKVLIIDDDTFLRKVYQSELIDHGFEVVTAVDGDDGLQKIVETNPDIVLLDLVMPKKNGFQVLTELKRSDILKTIPVVVLSNLAQPDDQTRARDLGAVDYLIKDNTTLSAIASTLEKQLVGRAAASERTTSIERLRSVMFGSDGVPATESQASTPVSSPATPIPTPSINVHQFCSQCGFKLEPSDKFCPNCGIKQ